jgi:anti-sigma factor RsiW
VNAHDHVRPLLAARPDELEPFQARLVEAHTAGCEACARELAGYDRLAHVLAVLPEVHADPPPGLLEQVLVAVARRRPGARELVAEHGPRALVAAGSAGALVATVFVARALHRRRSHPGSTGRRLRGPDVVGGRSLGAGPFVATPTRLKPLLARAR